MDGIILKTNTMKTKNRFLTIASLLLGLSVLCFSCKKKELAPDNSSSAQMGSLALHLHTNLDINEVERYDSVYVLTGGRKISVNISQLYISEIRLVKLDGSTYNIPDLAILKRMEGEKYSLGNVPSGNYKSIRFCVGLSPALNTGMPMMGDSTLNCSSMWFENGVPSSGHTFVNFQGKIDTSMAANNTVAQMQSFTFRIGTNSHLKSVSMPDRNFSVLPNQTQYIHIIIDYNKLFSGIILNAGGNLNVSNLSDNSSTLANQIANNISMMFTYD
jgi:hypothetical protein